MRIHIRLCCVLVGALLLILAASGFKPALAQTVWTSAPRFPQKLQNLCAGVINNKLYVAGGYNSNPSVTNGIPSHTLYVFDPALNSWSRKADMPTARWGAVAGVINGKLYVAGGEGGPVLSDLEVYDPASDSWSALAPMPTARFVANGGVINGKLYVAGGADAGGSPLNVLEAYDPSSNAWSTKAPLPSTRTLSGSGVIAGKLYVAGGAADGASTNTVVSYDPTNDAWSTVAPLATEHLSPAAGVINGQLHIAGGYNGVTYDNHIHEVYDPTTNQWLTSTPIPRAHSEFPATGVIGGNWYVAAGYDGTNPVDTTDVLLSTPLTQSGQLIISEFRLSGQGHGTTPNFNLDEYVEIYNNTDGDITVQALDGSGGYALAASDGVVRFTIPNGTVIPARGHFLGVNSGGYSLDGYPAGNAPSTATSVSEMPTKVSPTSARVARSQLSACAVNADSLGVPTKAGGIGVALASTTATGDATYTTDIFDNAGIALFNTANPANFTLANRLDAVGSTSESNTLYKEGAGYPAISSLPLGNYAFLRSLCGFTPGVGCSTPGNPKDTDNNASDFIYVDQEGFDRGAGRRLGAPGPENLSSPIRRDATIAVTLLDNTTSSGGVPNRARDFTSDPANNSAFGTLSIRRRVTNNTGSNVTRIRFRIVEITTFPNPGGGTADVRAITSAAATVSNVNDAATCLASTGSAATPCAVTVQGTVLETPPSQPNGGGYNSSLAVGTITTGTLLASGASINVQFLVGIQQTGSFRLLIITEALP